jgi:hypothetical protein
VIAKHAFKNALIPVLTLAGINLVLMINVAVVVETVFAWPGIGRLLYEGISFRDFPVVQGVVVMGGTMIVAVNLLVDVVYAVIDPRIRLRNSGHEYNDRTRRTRFAPTSAPLRGLATRRAGDPADDPGGDRIHGDLRQSTGAA